MNTDHILGFSLTDSVDGSYNKHRLEELGLKTIFNKKGKRKNLTSDLKIVQVCDAKMWEIASRLKDHSIKSYSKAEVIDSINFLEVFAVWLKIKGLDAVLDANMINVDVVSMLYKQEIDKTILVLEKLRKTIDQPQRLQKKSILSRKFKEPAKLAEHLYNNTLSHTEQVALQKPFKKALKCLKAYDKQIG